VVILKVSLVQNFNTEEVSNTVKKEENGKEKRNTILLFFPRQNM